MISYSEFAKMKQNWIDFIEWENCIGVSQVPDKQNTEKETDRERQRKRPSNWREHVLNCFYSFFYKSHMNFSYRYVNKYWMFIQNACSISIFERSKLFLINSMIVSESLYGCAYYFFLFFWSIKSWLRTKIHCKSIRLLKCIHILTVST